MFLPRPVFHINYYGNLDKDDAWLRPHTSFRNDDRLNSLELNANDGKRISPEGLSISENRKRKNKKPKKRNGQLLQDQFILRQPKPQTLPVFGTDREGNFTAKEKINKNQTHSLIDAYKQSNMSSQPMSWTEIEFTSDNSPQNITTQICFADTKPMTSCDPKPQFYFGESGCKSKDRCIVKESIPAPKNGTFKYPIKARPIQQHIKSTDKTKDPMDDRRIKQNTSTRSTKDPIDDGRIQQNRISITKDPINARRIQQCEQAKLMARYASDKTGISLTDIYTGRISFTDKSRVTTETTDLGVDQATDNHDCKDSVVCTTQPSAIPRW